ncbi:hypothetical protein C9926_01080 [Sulfurovum lithotrophicum]|nr:hypothetical protein C9926_01080 [Sulfurovum lithotrophicum]
MELVYLWVKDYKNIYRQGFNFSPKFNCHYDVDNNELTIDENDDYIDNFFGDNINVTAIVGKNGSGKSSIFEILTEFSSNKTTEYSGFFIYEYLKCYYIKEVNIEKIQTINNILALSESKNNIKMFGFDTKVTELLHSELKKYNGNSSSPTQVACRNESSDEILFQNKIYYTLKKDTKLFNFLDDQISFDYYQIILNKKDLESYIEGCDREDTLKNIIKNIKYSPEEHGTYINAVYSLLIMCVTNWYLTSHRTGKESEYINKIKNLDNIESFSDIILEKIKNISIEILKSIDTEVFNNEMFDLLLSTITKEQRILSDIQNNTSLLVHNSKIKDDTFLKKANMDWVMKYLFLFNVFTYDFYKKGSNNYSYLEMSSGEKQYLNLFINIAYTLYELNSVDDKLDVIMLFDEIELSFHPSWQKRVISDILILHKRINKEIKLDMVFATHSPFHLSDIPKQNIIFLDKDKDGKCKVVDGLKDKKQTFGANIHTLLSDSFFMEDGLMGEFAKGKIDRAIGLLNKDSLSDDELKYCEQIISIIGEPIVKNQLQRMLDSKKISYLARDTKEEIEFLKHRIDLLSKRL